MIELGYGGINVTSTRPYNLEANEKLICVRIGDEDFHFMRYDTDGSWYHKPGPTDILKYNWQPDDKIWNGVEYAERIWTNESSLSGVIYEPDTTYDSEIYYITYFEEPYTVVNLTSATVEIAPFNFRELNQVVVPSEIDGKTVVGIASSAFAGWSGYGLALPNSVATIGAGAFSGCKNLLSLTLPFVGASRNATNASALFGYVFGTASYSGGTATQQYYASSSSVTYCVPSQLWWVEITDAVAFKYGAFYNCNMIGRVQFSNGLTSIGDYAFYNCSSLDDISIMPSVQSIGELCFL